MLVPEQPKNLGQPQVKRKRGRERERERGREGEKERKKERDKRRKTDAVSSLNCFLHGPSLSMCFATFCRQEELTLGWLQHLMRLWEISLRRSGL